MKTRSRKPNAGGAKTIAKSSLSLAESLPDEMVSEILSWAFTVPDEIFSENGPNSPFATFKEPSSAFLLVCKAWFRVGFPLLFKDIVLRSTAQAKALSQVLVNTTALGQLVTKLRVEGGFGASMRTILKCSPNITHLFLSLDITAADITTGLCDGLHLINPTYVILRYICYKSLSNKMLQNLSTTLGECLSNWDNLQLVDIPRTLAFWDHHAHTIFDGLRKSASLHTVVIPEANYAHASWVALNLKGTGLRTIQIKNTITNKEDANSDFFKHFDENPTVTALLKYTVEEKLPPPHLAKQRPIQPSIAPSLNPFFIPMDSASVNVQESIWKRMLYYTMFTREQEADIYRKGIPRRLRLPLLLVSKTFNKLALPYYYSFVHIKTPSAIAKFLHVLGKYPTVGLQVRAVVFNRFTWPLGEIELGSIKLPSLQCLSLSESVTDATKLLHSYGSTLTELTIVIEAVKNLDINIFVLCPNLACLIVCFNSGYLKTLPDVTDFVLENTKHHNLNKVKFDLSNDYWYRTSRRNLHVWDDVFEALEPTHFPNLREIQLECFLWPRTERDIAKSIWVRWAERFLESGVSMMDKDGEKWPGRLESRPR
ncbi:hypothetical protein B0H12DRAFT_300890 [Mycena haematopus]|nr:hypothetical protein B0H12DRAFT_300890 [Mycena haematopus]